jgi:hypothetical protein
MLSKELGVLALASRNVVEGMQASRRFCRADSDRFMLRSRSENRWSDDSGRVVGKFRVARHPGIRHFLDFHLTSHYRQITGAIPRGFAQIRAGNHLSDNSFPGSTRITS